MAEEETRRKSRCRVADRVPRGAQHAAQRRGLGSARDRLHGRAVVRRSVVEMARTVGRNTVVDGRDPVAGGPATPLNENAVVRGEYLSENGPSARRQRAAERRGLGSERGSFHRWWFEGRPG